ncbi:hypothetical protein K7X08_034091 [Anisodus acutangulus]|uniref:Uncharacterized protein n=1 Tax=Anisodus acutangulus TaxID=402998 RepID=A0A9Q1LZ26_9SOLA|nr:hypothetical protein K7X08_034091 [Anisodus acutangulus]
MIVKFRVEIGKGWNCLVYSLGRASVHPNRLGSPQRTAGHYNKGLGFVLVCGHGRVTDAADNGNSRILLTVIKPFISHILKIFLQNTLRAISNILGWILLGISFLSHVLPLITFLKLI